MYMPVPACTALQLRAASMALTTKASLLSAMVCGSRELWHEGGQTEHRLRSCRYAWTYVETTQGVKKGDRVWQLGFGSGFKCCCAVWVALKKNDEKHDAWMDVESYT